MFRSQTSWKVVLPGLCECVCVCTCVQVCGECTCAGVCVCVHGISGGKNALISLHTLYCTNWLVHVVVYMYIYVYVQSYVYIVGLFQRELVFIIVYDSTLYLWTSLWPSST